MKVALISPNSMVTDHAIRSLSAVLKRDGHETRMIHLPKDNGRELLEEGVFTKPYPGHIVDEVIGLLRDADIVGFTVMSQFLAVVIDLTREVRKRTGTMVLWGGAHPTIAPDECLRYTDCICVGEGEAAFPELVSRIRDGRDYFTTENFWFNKEGRVMRNPLRPYLKDLDSLPFQDFSCRDEYVLWDGMLKPITKEILGDNYNTYMTRGCPNSCAFCSNAYYNRLYAGQTVLRARSAASVIKEIKEARDSGKFSGIKRVRLIDDYFSSLSPETIKDFAARYKTEVGVPLSIVGWSPLTVTDEKVRMLVETGMDNARMGIEHGSSRVRKMFNRIGDEQKILDAAYIFNRYRKKLHITYDLITDNPYETDDDSAESIRFFSKLPRPYHVTIYSLTPFPGTLVYKWAVRDGYLSGNWLDDLNNGRFNGRSLSREYKFTFEDNYYNNMYLIFQAYYLPRWLKRFLINPSLVRLKITYPAYYLLKLSLGFVRYAGMVKNRKDLTGLLKRGFDALRQGDFNRIKNSILRPKRTW